MFYYAEAYKFYLTTAEERLKQQFRAKLLALGADEYCIPPDYLLAFMRPTDDLCLQVVSGIQPIEKSSHSQVTLGRATADASIHNKSCKELE